MRFKKNFIIFFSLLIFMCILLSSCSSTSSKFSTGKIYDSENAGSSFHTFSGKTQSVAKNDYIELGIDKNNHSIIVKDLQENYVWNTLSEKNNNSAYAFGLQLYTKNGIYNLNTQDNSVAFSTSSYEVKDNVLTVSYMLSDKKETAKKSIEEMTDSDIFVYFKAVFTMKDQSVNLNIDFGEMKCTEDAFVSEFYAMPFFGASYNDTADDYFLIPDNSGAIMHLDKNDAATDSVTVNVYGENPYNPNEEKVASATVPVYGIKRNTSAFAAVITDADAHAVIKAQRATAGNPSQAFSEFIITEIKTISSDEESNSVLKGKSYTGNINIVYKFLSGNNATYSAMASVAREEFIADSILSSSGTQLDDSIPFSLTVIGAADNTVLTTTQQTNDILSILKGKGISNIALSYKGLLSGGLAQKNLYNSEINRKLGGKNGLEDLHRYTKTQNCSLFLGTNIFSSSKKYLLSNKSLSISKANAEFSMLNDMSFNENTSSSLLTRIGKETFQIGKEKTNPSLYSQTAQYSMNLLNITKLSDRFQTYLENDIFNDIDGITVTDAGKILYSDNKTDRQTAMQTVSSLLRAVSNYGQLCVEGGNIYSVHNAEMITGMSFDTFYPESENYESVPFVQSVLHGNVLYTGTPIDAGNPLYRYEMLRYIEYGAVPCYEWIYADENVYCYNGYLLSERITEIVDFYNDVNEIFADLADDTIVSHRKIEKNADGEEVSGVYCTTYSDGTEIYVNYTGSIVSTAENIAIGPYNYVKVKR